MPINQVENLLNYYISTGKTELACKEMKIFLELLDGSSSKQNLEIKQNLNLH